MRKMKRMIALVTVAMFLLSFAAPSVFAATKEDAFGRLKALGVAVGDSSGDPMYDKTFTRAEAAAIMVNLSGMKTAIDAAKGPTKFKDVPGSHWASGVINLAVGAGIIKGYPDGTYKPEKEVSYAELAAMLVGVLGYGPKLQGTWPSNVIGKAAQLGLLDGLTVADYNAAAVRSNVFLASDNAIDTKPLKETKDGYEEDSKTLMEGKLSVAKKDEGTVTVTPNYGEKNKVTVKKADGTSYTVTTLDSVDGNALYGEKVVPWVKDDKVFFFDRKNASDVVKDKVVATKTTDTKIYLDDKDRDYNLAAKLVVQKDFVTYDDTTATLAKDVIDTLADGTAVKLVLDGDGKVAFAEVFTYSKALVKDVNAADEKITIKEGTPGTLELKNDNYVIVKNGVVVTVGDVKANDVLDVAKNGADTKFYIYASDKTVTGSVESYTIDDSNYKVVIGGTTYKTTSLKISTNNGDSYTAAINDVVGKTVTARLNKDGKIAFIVADSAAASSFFPVVVKEVAADGTIDKNVWVKVAKVDGTNTSYQVTKDTKINGTKVDNSDTTGLKAASPVIQKESAGGTVVSASSNSILKIELTSDGKVKEFKTYSAADPVEITSLTSPVNVSKTNDTVGGYKANSDTKLAYKNSDGDYKAMTWADFEALVDSSDQVAKNMTLIVDKGIVKNVFITSASAVLSDWKYGVVNALGNNSTLDNYTEVWLNGELKQIKGRDNAAVVKALIQFKISDDELSNVTVAEAAYALGGTDPAADRKFTVLDYNETDKLLKIKKVGAADSTASWVVYDKDAFVFKGKDKKTIADAKDKNVWLYDVMNDKKEGTKTDGAYDFVIIEE